MDYTLFWSVFVGFTILYFTVGMLASQKTSNEEDYFLASRRFGVLPITFTLVATQLGAGMILGTAEEAFHSGFYGLSYNVGICLGFLLLACGFAGKLRSFNITTTAEIFEKHYRSFFLRKIASILSILTLGGILAAQILASRKLLGAMLGEHGNAILILFWLVVIFYTMFGGLRAVVATDIFQVFVILAIFCGIFIYSLTQRDILGFESLSHWLKAQHFASNTSAISQQRLYSFLLMPLLFSLIEQDLAQRFFAAKSQKTAILSAFLAGCFILLFSLIPIYFGLEARLVVPLHDPSLNPLLASIKAYGVEILWVLCICGLIAAIGSTADSLLCAISSNIVSDFKLTEHIHMSKNKGLWLSRIVTLCVGLLALISAYYFNNILELVTQSYEISVSCLFVPLFFAFFIKNPKKEAAGSAIFVGFASFLFFRLLRLPFPHELLTLLFSSMAYFLGDRLSRRGQIA